MFLDSMRKQTNQCAQYKVKIVTKHDSRNTQVSIFLKKKKIGFPCCSTREDLSIDVSITNVGLILTKTQSSKLGVSCQSLYLSPDDGMHNYTMILNVKTNYNPNK